MVRECISEACAAAVITCLISLMPLMTAENSMKFHPSDEDLSPGTPALACVVSAMILASVVLPTPGGPQRIMEPDPESSSLSRSICTRNGLPGPSRCSCPLYSSRVRGRIRSAKGAVRTVPLGPSGS